MEQQMTSYPVPAEAASAHRAGDPVPAHPGNLSAIIRRIEEALDVETDGNRYVLEIEKTAYKARNSPYLYDLNKAAGLLSPRQLTEEHRLGLERLRAKLEVNERVILAHLSAVKEVADLLRSAIQSAEADGTYSAREFGGPSGYGSF
jgi:hypothetical protein